MISFLLVILLSATADAEETANLEVSCSGEVKGHSIIQCHFYIDGEKISPSKPIGATAKYITPGGHTVKAIAYYSPITDRGNWHRLSEKEKIVELSAGQDKTVTFDFGSMEPQE